MLPSCSASVRPETPRKTQHFSKIARKPYVAKVMGLSDCAGHGRPSHLSMGWTRPHLFGKARGFQSRIYPLNINELSDRIATETQLNKDDARKIVDAVFAAIGEAAARGEEVALAGFGKFKVTDRPEREGRNPSTGAAIKIAASKKLGFTPAKAIKDRLNA
jgi:DNA-binding protein HU-beta